MTTKERNKYVCSRCPLGAVCIIEQYWMVSLKCVACSKLYYAVTDMKHIFFKQLSEKQLTRDEGGYVCMMGLDEETVAVSGAIPHVEGQCEACAEGLRGSDIGAITTKWHFGHG